MEKRLSDKQIALVLFGAIVGYGVLGLPKQVTELAGTGGWVCILLATIYAIIITNIITYLNYSFPGKTLDEYSQILVGKFFSYVFLVIYAVYFFLIFTFVARISSEVIKYTILIKTPEWSLILLFLIVVYYAVSKRLSGLGKLCEIYGYIIISGSFVIHFLMYTQGKFINIRPLFVVDNMLQYVKGSLFLTVPFLGIEVLTFIPIYKKENKNVFKYNTIILVIIGLLYIVVFQSCISVIGSDDIIHYKDALIAAMRRIDIVFLEFLSRIDGILLSLWILAVFCTISVLAYGSVFYLSKIYKDVKFNFLAFIVFLLAYIVALIPAKFMTVERIIEYIGLLGLLPGVIIPLVLAAITKVNKYDKK